MLNILYNIIIFIFTISILIIVHEYGHFIASRICKVHVEQFSIGFGKALYSFQDNKNTIYKICIIPVGGYVKILNENKNTSSALKSKCFNNKSFIKRFFIIILGPLFNCIFSILLYWIIFLHGFYTVRPIIHYIEKNSIAEKIHILPDMEIIAINNEKTYDWNSVKLKFLKNINNNYIILKLKKFNSINIIEKKIILSQFNITDPLKSLGIYPYMENMYLYVNAIKKNSFSEKYNLKLGDILLSINDKSLDSLTTFVNIIQNNINKLIFINIKRNNNIICINIIPKTISNNIKDEFFGIVPKKYIIPQKYKILNKYSFFHGLYYSIYTTIKTIYLIIKLIFKIFIGNASLYNLSGPISIAKEAIISLHYGIINYLIFLAIISINLSIFNLFPLPSLDGGHILFLIIEKIKNSPISEKMQEISYKFGTIILIFLMILTLFNDFLRL